MAFTTSIVPPCPSLRDRSDARKPEWVFSVAPAPRTTRVFRAWCGEIVGSGTAAITDWPQTRTSMRTSMIPILEEGTAVRGGGVVAMTMIDRSV